VDVWIHIFLTSALAGGEWSVSRPDRFIPGERAPLPIGYKVGWTTVPIWTTLEKRNFFTLPGLELVQSAARLSYTGSTLLHMNISIKRLIGPDITFEIVRITMLQGTLCRCVGRTGHGSEFIRFLIDSSI
jgi:hypothetical protein